MRMLPLLPKLAGLLPLRASAVVVVAGDEVAVVAAVVEDVEEVVVVELDEVLLHLDSLMPTMLIGTTRLMSGRPCQDRNLPRC